MKFINKWNNTVQFTLTLFVLFGGYLNNDFSYSFKILAIYLIAVEFVKFCAELYRNLRSNENHL